MLLSNAGSTTEQQIEEQIDAIACSDASSSSTRSCETDVTDVTLQNSRQRRLSQQGQSSDDIIVEFVVWIETICGNTDCTDAQAVGNEIYNQVTGDIKQAIEDGTLIGSATATIDFCPVIIPIVAQLLPDFNKAWYPDWGGQSHTCKNDGNYP